MGWDHSVDVVVMGSGGAGQCAALRAADLGLDVLILEKGETWGGSTAMSGGAIWVPNNRSARDKGLEDSEEAGVEYLLGLTKGTVDEERIRTFVREANRMIEYLEANSRLTVDALDFYPDYHPEEPGGRAGGRSLDPAAFDGTALGNEFRTLHEPYPPALVMGKFMMTIPQARGLLQPGFRPKLEVAKGMARYAMRWRKRRRFGRDPFLSMGQALMGRLRLSLIDRGVPMWLACPVESLETEGGRVVGVVARRGGTLIRIEARCGVVIAAGGFERNDAMRKQYQRAPIDASWTVGNHDNTGDGIRAAADVGATLDTELMREAWWMPATLAPGQRYNSVLMIEKSMPHGMFVNREGKRFVNEAESYNDLVIDMYTCHERDGITIPAWFIVDGTYRSRYNLGPVLPSFVMSDKKLPPAWQPDAGWLHRRDTVEDLARDLGIAPDTLRASVDRFNGFAAAGEDADFRRGDSANDRYYSDPRAQPNPSLGALTKPPFYAVPISPSDLGTKAGLVTDLAGRVLDESGEPIPGLYGAGNSTSTVMGTRYAGAGATIAPAMVFGFLAGEAIAADSARST
ncbi:MAG: 3-oxosteroid 1-dehydrogenase [Acidimicrobiaceae bacterium]